MPQEASSLRLLTISGNARRAGRLTLGASETQRTPARQYYGWRGQKKIKQGFETRGYLNLRDRTLLIGVAVKKEGGRSPPAIFSWN
jgi:hypothetical protein